MFTINENYLSLKQSYLFSEIAKRVNKFIAENPQKKVVKLGIGDVTRPLSPAIIKAMHEAVDEMAMQSTFKGYGPEQGYDFIRNDISKYYGKRSVHIEADEIFVSDGAKSDIGNIGDILGTDNTVLIPDPVYPVYVDTNMMAGRNIIYLDSNENNSFKPMPQGQKADVVYLCSPNNPTGSVYTYEELKSWVDYARSNNMLILFDAAYEAYISDDKLPHSIFEIEGAKECAIEFCSFSKTAGFTGTRCAYTVVPKVLKCTSKDGSNVQLNSLWNRRQTTKFNGVPYIVQKGAAVVFSDEGQKEIKETIGYYMENARIIREALTELGIVFFGGSNAPYIWLKCPGGMDSWQFFDKLLNEAAVVGTPGAGFGKNGEGYFRLTAFGSRENTIEAIERLKRLLGSM